jgi:SecD/SecF fusion protein
MFIAEETKSRSLFAIVALLSIAGCSRHEPVGFRLIYEVETNEAPKGAKIDMQNFLTRVQRRLEGFSIGEARLTDDGRFQVDVYGKDEKQLDRAKRVLSQAGVLRFRILATRHDHQILIDRALKQDATERFVFNGLDGARSEQIAEWVTLNQELAASLKGSPQFAMRQTADGKTEILVAMDPYNVDGSYLSRAYSSFDQSNHPCIYFTFNAEGAKLFGGLTGSHLPGPDGFTRQLGVILDGTMMTAPTIQAPIYENGQITGNYTERETRDLATVLTAGSFPARLRLVSEGAVESGEGTAKK